MWPAANLNCLMPGIDLVPGIDLMPGTDLVPGTGQMCRLQALPLFQRLFHHRNNPFREAARVSNRFSL